MPITEAKYEHRIMGQYSGQPKEVIDTADDKSTADYLLGEYRLASGPGWKIWVTGPHLVEGTGNPNGINWSD